MPPRKTLSKEPPRGLEPQKQLPLYAKPDDLAQHASPDGWKKVRPSFLKRMKWTTDEWEKFRMHWLESDTEGEHNRLLWANAKIERYNEAPRLAIERQKKLRSNQWLTAFLLAQDFKREYIASFLHIEIDYVDELIKEIKDIADVETQPGVVRWFLGL
jgi:hypothetical protein